MTDFKKVFTKKNLPFILSGAVILATAFVALYDTNSLLKRETDEAPKISFTWTPAGAVDLKEMRGFLSITDDYALDFTTYRLTIEEIEKTVDLPIEGLIGREYEQQISFGLIADNPRLYGRDRITVKIEIADDRGQKTELVRTVMIKR